jgi:superfamily II DNA or RNA helicase
MYAKTKRQENSKLSSISKKLCVDSVKDHQRFEFYCVDWCLKNLENVHKVYHQSLVPEDVRWDMGYIHSFNQTRLNRLSKIPDVGFDLIIVEKKNDSLIYIGGQSKLYSSRVGPDDLGSWFLKIMVIQRKNPNNGGYLFTTNGITEILQEDLWVHESPAIAHWQLPNFQRSIPHVETIVSQPIPEEQMVPRDYQLDLIVTIIKCFETDKVSRQAMSLPCRLGKTLIAVKVLDKLRPSIILVIATERTEVDNLVRVFLKHLPTYNTAVFDTDGSLDLDELKGKILQQNLIIFTTHVSALKLFALMGSVQNDSEDSEDLNVGYSEDEYEDSENFATNSVELDDDAKISLYLRNAFLVVDECHDLMNKSAELLELVNIPKKALFMSATIPSNFEDCVSITDLHDKYGFEYALNNNYIVDYTVWTPSLVFSDSGEAPRLIDSVLPLECRHMTFDAEPKLVTQAFVLINMMLKTGSRRCIVYLTTIEECKQFNQAFEKLAVEYHGIKAWSERVNGDSSALKRQAIIREFESGAFDFFKILTSCGCLDQAVDIPRCDSIFITSVSTNEIRTIQRISRAFTLDSSNPIKHNNILMMWTDGSEKSLQCLQMLKDNDPQFITKIKCVSMAYDGQTSPVSLADVDRTQQNVVKYVQASCVTMEDRLLQKVKDLEAYCTEHNKLPPATLRGGQLGRFVSNQKKAWNSKKLTEDRKKILCSISLFLAWTKEEKTEKTEIRSFEESIKLVVAYCTKHKKLPPANAKGGQLGVFVDTQKKVWNNKKLTEDRKTLLCSISLFLAWTKEEKIEPQSFAESIKLTLAYCTEHNKLPPARSQLGSFVNNQKTAWNIKKLTEDRKTLLLSIPLFLAWVEEEKTDMRSFKESIELILTYCIEHNKLPPTSMKLGVFVVSQKTAWKNNKLTEDRKTLLLSIPLFLAWTEEEKTDKCSFKESIELILTYCIEHDKLPPTSMQLGVFVASQKTAWKNNKLTEDRKTLLLSIPLFLAWTEEEKTVKRSFEESIKLTLSYCTGHNKFPPASSGKLGKFVSHQKTAWNAKKLTKDKKTLLLSIPLFLAWTEDQE